MALESEGYVTSRSMPPSVLFKSTEKKRKNVYECIDKVVENAEISPVRKEEVKAHLLFQILGRPVFTSELVKTGIRALNILYPISEEEYLILKKRMEGADIRIDKNDRAYKISSANPPVDKNTMLHLLSDIIRLAYDIPDLAGRTE